LLVLVAACQRSESPRAPERPFERPTTVPAFATLRTMIDDQDARSGANSFRYVGHWEHVGTHKDGRALGTSSRDFHAGDIAVVSFNGTQLRLYGVLGWKGGYSSLTLDHQPLKERPDFYAPRVRPGSLVYTSPMLPSGSHTLTVEVTGQRDPQSVGDYVNIDYAVVTTSMNAKLPP
jgi:hypothetical protein